MAACHGCNVGTARVALRKESVDRNDFDAVRKMLGCVALRKESVDRNVDHIGLLSPTDPSLSARRAWIEIYSPDGHVLQHTVALRKESVDRNSGMRYTRAVPG